MTILTTMTRGTAALAAAFVLSALPATAQQGPPDGVVTIEGGALALGVGYSWGKGSLSYGGAAYPFKIRGLSVVDIGASKYSATGKVYNLKRYQDLAGTYASAEVGATVGGGASATALKNDKGVVIHMDATRAGAQFTLAPKGMTITFK